MEASISNSEQLPLSCWWHEGDTAVRREMLSLFREDLDREKGKLNRLGL